MYDVHGLASFSAAFDKELTDDDWATLRKDFYLSFNKHSFIEKLSPSFVLFIVSKGMEHTLKYYLTEEYKNTRNSDNPKLVELLSHITVVDEKVLVVERKADFRH